MEEQPWCHLLRVDNPNLEHLVVKIVCLSAWYGSEEKLDRFMKSCLEFTKQKQWSLLAERVNSSFIHLLQSTTI